MGLFSKEEPQPIQIKGHQLTCPICKNDLFFREKAQLNSSIFSFFNIDWMNRSATCFVCSECTHITWFDS